MPDFKYLISPTGQNRLVEADRHLEKATGHLIMVDSWRTSLAFGLIMHAQKLIKRELQNVPIDRNKDV